MSHCFSTVSRPSMSQVRRTQRPQEQHEDCRTKYNEIQVDKKLRSAKLRTENKEQNFFDSESRSDLSFTLQKGTEVIHREVKGGTKTKCYLKENQSHFSETRRLKDLVKKHSQHTQEGDPRYTLCNIDYTSKDGYTQTKPTPECIDEQIVDVRVPLTILEETVAVMKLAHLNTHKRSRKELNFHSRSSSSRLSTIA